MNRDDIIRHLLQAADETKTLVTNEPNWPLLMRFAALVAAEKDKQIAELQNDFDRVNSQSKTNLLYAARAIEERETARREEREACARVCDKRAADYQMGFEEKYEAQACAYDIRARSEEPKRHPGYIVGDHWLQAAYTRICTGETEDEVMTDYGWQRARGEA